MDQHDRITPEIEKVRLEPFSVTKIATKKTKTIK